MKRMLKVITHTSARAADHDAIKPNTGGAGPSLGILLWTPSMGNRGTRAVRCGRPRSCCGVDGASVRGRDCKLPRTLLSAGRDDHPVAAK